MSFQIFAVIYSQPNSVIVNFKDRSMSIAAKQRPSSIECYQVRKHYPME